MHRGVAILIIMLRRNVSVPEPATLFLLGLAFVFLPLSLPCLPCEALLFRAKRGATPKGHEDTKDN